jgi:SAM-dependent methyltransferase
LRTEQYRDPSNLAARASLHARFSTNPVGWHRWLFDQFDFGGRCEILDVGAGPGMLWQENGGRIPPGWRITLFDLSPGMLASARAGLGGAGSPRVSCGDARFLPFSDGQFDTVLACHMLYHIEDLDDALGDIRRVLRPGGRLLATTNGANHLRELRAWAGRFEPGFALDAIGTAFSIETAPECLERFFDSVHLVRYEDGLEVTEIEPLVAYLQSISGRERFGEDVADQCRLHFEQMLREQGTLRITKDTGLFVAVKGAS